MAVESFLINVGLSIVGNWLFPKKKEQQSPEDIPSLGQGSDIYLGWGLFITQGNLLYATPADLAGHGTDRSTFGVLGIVNPSSDCELLAIRVNNVLSATKTPLFGITQPSVSGVYEASGFKIKNGFAFTSQEFTPISNVNFQKNGFNGLQYQGLTWVAFNNCNRQTYGGFNSRVSLVYKNKATSLATVPYTIKGDDTVIVALGISYGNSKNPWSYWYTKTFEHGFFGVYQTVIFDTRSDQGVLAQGGLIEYMISVGNASNDTGLYLPPTFVTSAISPDVLPTTAGNLTAVQYSGYVAPLTSDKITVVEGSKPLYTVTLNNQYTLPFYSNYGIFYDGLGNVIYTPNVPNTNIYCAGWDDSYFYYGFYDSENQAYVPSISLPTVGTTQSSSTSLGTIISDLLEAKGSFINGAQFIDQSTEQTVRGYTCTLDSITDKITNLCSVFAKFCFQDGEGDFWLIDYPIENPIASFELGDFLSELEFTSSAESEQPDQIQYSYKSFNNGLSEKLIHVGNSNNNGNSTDIKIDLVQKESEAKISAWNTLFLRSQTNLSLSFRSLKKIPRAGLVISVLGDNYLVANLEIGTDLSFRYTCVNYVSVREPFPGYMISESNNINQVSSTEILPFLIPVENTKPISSQFEGGLIYTNKISPVVFHKDNGDITAIRTINPVTGGFIGVVILALYNEITVIRKDGISILPLPMGLIRIGLSWVSYTSFTQNKDNFTFLGIEIGKFSSSDVIRNGDYVAQINSNNYAVGFENIGNVILSQVTQDNTEIVIRSYPETLAGNNLITSFGQITANYPYGYPCSGILIAKVAHSTFAGFTHIWISKPGGHQDFPFNEPIDFQEPFNKRFFTKQSVSSFIDLGEISLGYTVLPSMLNIGSYTLFQAKQGYVNDINLRFPKGSFQWVGISI